MSDDDGLVARLWARVQRAGPDECWLWQGPTQRGYGHIGLKKRTLAVHRVAYEASVGPIPEGLTIDHICRNKACCNPAHLRVLSFSENARMNGNWAKTHCKRGHEFTPETTYTPPGRPTARHCMLCQNALRRTRRAEGRHA